MNLLLLPILLPLLTALLCLLLSTSLMSQKRLTLVCGALHVTSAAFLLSEVSQNGIQLHVSGGWAANVGISLVADLFSSIMLLVTGGVSLMVLIFASEDLEQKLQQRFFYPLYNFLMLGVSGALITGDIFNMYVWFEIMLLSSFILLSLGRKSSQLEGAVKYVTINIFSSMLFLAGAALLYAKCGTLNMAEIARILSLHQDSELINSTAILFICSFAIKSAFFPFFLWLPASYHTPPVAITALFSALLTKVGIYALVRICTLIFAPDREMFQGLFFWMAALTMVIGVLCAAAQFEIRRILSVHIVSQVGYILLGLALFTPLGIAAALFYMIHNIVVKTNLFLISGLILNNQGSCELKKIGGLYKSAPLLSLFFVISAFSLAGLPPLSGFWGKFLVLKAAADDQQFLLLGVGLGVGLITLFSMAKIWEHAFWKASPESTGAVEIKAAGNSWSRIIPVGCLCFCTLAMGFQVENLFQLCLQTSEQLLNPQIYINAVLGVTK